MTEVTRCSCWHQNFVPKGLSAPALGLYTCIKSWKNVYKIRLQRDFFLTCSKWLKWQEVSVDAKILSPGGCLPMNCSYIHLSANELQLYTFIKSWKGVYNVRGWRDFFKLATKDQSEDFLLTSKFWPKSVVCSCLRAIHIYKIMKKCA